MRWKLLCASWIALWTACTKAPAVLDVETLLARCDQDPSSDACHALVAARGVTLASSTARGTWETPALRVFLRPDGEVIFGDLVASVRQQEHHRIVGLDGALERLREDAEPPAVLLYADRARTYGDVVDVLYTTSRAGFHDLRVAVETQDGPWALDVAAPQTWDPDNHRIVEAKCSIHLTVAGGRVKVKACGEEAVDLELGDVDAIAELKRASRKRVRGDQGARVWADADTPWPVVVGVLDALRGPGCSLHGGGPACDPLGIMFDLEPPIPWRPGSWDKLQVTVERVEGYGTAKRPRDLAKLRKRVDRTLPAIAACLRGSDVMRLQMPDNIVIFLGTDDAGKEASAAPHVPACVPEAFAPQVENISAFVPGDAGITLAISVPTEP